MGDSGSQQLEVRGMGRALESFAASPRDVRSGRIQIGPQRSDALYAPRLRRYEGSSVGSDISAGFAKSVGGGSFLGLAALAVSLPFGVTDPASTSILLWVSIAGTVVGGGITAGLIPRRSRWRRQLVRAIAFDFQSWTRARYGLELENPSPDLVGFVASPKVDGAHQVFQHQGQQFKIVAHEASFYIEQVRDVSALDYAPVGIAAIDADDALGRVRELPGEAGLLGERLLSLLALSVGEELSPEQDHVLRRVRADALQTVALHTKLAKLQAVDEESEAMLRDTLASLTSEVDGIIEQWRQGVQAELEVQRNYVRERQLHTPGYLALPEGTDRTVPEAEDSNLAEAQVE